MASNHLVSELSHGKRVHMARFSPDGQRVVTASQDRTARVWDAGSGAPITPPLKHEMVLIGARFTLDGRRVITVSQDRTARVWDATEGQPLTPPIRHPDELQRRSPDLHPDGRRAITAAGNIARIWDIDTGNPTVDPLTHFGVVRSAMFSRDGRSVVTTSKDKTARVWDTATGTPITEPLHHDDAVFHAEFSADGRWVASGSDDGCVKIWEVPLAPNPIPAWLPDLAEAIGGLRFNAENMLEAVPIERLWRLRQQLASFRSSDPWTTWANWFFDDASHRSFWPNFPAKPTQFGEDR
jgi:WD40 repeat protein